MHRHQKKILYLGTDPTHFQTPDAQLIHYPIIEIVPLQTTEIDRALLQLNNYTHLIFTSKNAVQIFFSRLCFLKLPSFQGQTIAIGSVTAEKLKAQGYMPHIARGETQEGVIQLIEDLKMQNGYFFFPHSSLSRPVLIDYFKKNQIRYHACALYETKTRVPDVKPDLKEVDELVFTSPSTVKAFIEIFGRIPVHKKITAIGPITAQALDKSGMYYQTHELP